MHVHDIPVRFLRYWSNWCISLSSVSILKLNIAFVHSIQFETEFVKILQK